MRPLNLSHNIIPVGELKSNLSKYINNISVSGDPLVITKNGRPACVLISPSEYDEIVYKTRLTDSINRGISDAESGNTLTSDELRAQLKAKRDLKVSY